MYTREETRCVLALHDTANIDGQCVSKEKAAMHMVMCICLPYVHLPSSAGLPFEPEIEVGRVVASSQCNNR